MSKNERIKKGIRKNYNLNKTPILMQKREVCKKMYYLVCEYHRNSSPLLSENEQYSLFEKHLLSDKSECAHTLQPSNSISRCIPTK